MLQDLRRKVLAGEEVSAEEYARIVDSLRTDRSAGASKPKKANKKEAEPIIHEDLFDLVKQHIKQ